MTTRTFAMLMALTALLSACTNLADEGTDAPTLATITGTLTLADDTMVPDDQLRLALLWGTNEVYGSGSEDMGTCEQPFTKAVQRSEQQVDIEATFPNQFALNLTAPPPPDGLIPSEENGDPDHGEALLIAYADGNGNGQLDSRPDGQPSPDTVLGSTEPTRQSEIVPGDVYQIEFYYFNEPYTFGEPGSEAFFEYPAGFSQFRYVVGDDSNVRGEVTPIDTPIDMTLTAAPELQDQLCEYLCMDQMPFECPASPAGLPAPPADAEQYMVGNTGMLGWKWSRPGGDYGRQLGLCARPPASPFYSWTHESCEGCTCRTANCVYMGDSVPAAEWPCAP